MKDKVLAAMAARGTGAVGLLALAWLATKKLSPAELGYLFSFLSFGAFVQLADFGISYAALQGGGLRADSFRSRELPGLAAYLLRWNLIIAGAATAVAAVIGWETFSSAELLWKGVPVDWRGPWIGYLAGTILFQSTMPGIALREGSGHVVQMWLLRLAQEGVGCAAGLLSLGLGGQLWSLTTYATARGVIALAWLALHPLPRISGAPDYSVRQWIREAWPFQWKIGLSLLSGFLIFRAFSAVILYEKGPVPAGQFGLAIAIMNLLISISSAWPMSQAARYATFMASGRARELHEEFPSMLRASAALAFAAAAVATAGLWWARVHGFTFALRLTDPTTTTLILAAAVAHHVVLCYAMLLRSEGREPMVLPSILGGVATLLAIWAAAHFGTLRDVAIVNLICAFGGIPVAYLIHRSRRMIFETPSAPSMRSAARKD